jgi:homoserine O-acetyltransferase/O-succinyltransferase
VEGNPVREIFELGDFTFESGVTLPDAKLGYVTYGEINAARDNVVVFPTSNGSSAGRASTRRSTS